MSASCFIQLHAKHEARHHRCCSGPPPTSWVNWVTYQALDTTGVLLLRRHSNLGRSSSPPSQAPNEEQGGIGSFPVQWLPREAGKGRPGSCLDWSAITEGPQQCAKYSKWPSWQGGGRRGNATAVVLRFMLCMKHKSPFSNCFAVLATLHPVLLFCYIICSTMVA